ncbi:hypothetical protein EVA_17291 [gut metagenome]|uniref:Uncharacterized protein n=1 Tax=gut metagenome TaxID=749906 RepID=J9FYJ0_9ZZZZ
MLLSKNSVSREILNYLKTLRGNKAVNGILLIVQHVSV